MTHGKVSFLAPATFALLASAAAAPANSAESSSRPCWRRPPPAFGVRPPNRRRAAAVLPLTARPPSPPPEGFDDAFDQGPGGFHVYAEGMTFDGDMEAEVLAMGGDPFFLVDDDDDDEDDSKDADDEVKSEDSVEGPSMTFMAMAGALNAVAGDATKGGAEEVVKRHGTDGLGPTPVIPPPPAGDVDDWDGWEIEDAHFD
uniref:Plastid lipid-associated protein/fibrillin conserved domain-containing protein n=1 Tax=Odontella aurita TaxID=265563 RepID=A0A7S4J879_9STRA|mmetsp:Transcript_41004/g.123743  ORF Transcript_41004/g.123743 Transcript_41004/m.123743 type:complete len:200 (+) Transcript_41004:173-772(+)